MRSEGVTESFDSKESLLAGSGPRPKIVTAILGGLGNQMFQYAVARRLASVNQAELLIYLGDRYKSENNRAYGLDRFSIAGRIASDAEAGRGFRLVKMPLPFRGLSLLFPQLRRFGSSGFILEEGNAFEARIIDLRGSFQLSGFWQNERYFADIPSVIRSDFNLREPLDSRNQHVLDLIRGSASAFIHVRRTDYLDKPGVYGTCSLDYYRAAEKLLRERVGGNLKMFVFSDDPAWVKQNAIGGIGAEYIDWNGAAPERDIALMRHCRHAIIANSSFSWWGAWLGDGAERVVIAPAIWFNGVPEFSDIVPARWLRLG